MKENGPEVASASEALPEVDPKLIEKARKALAEYLLRTAEEFSATSSEAEGNYLEAAAIVEKRGSLSYSRWRGAFIAACSDVGIQREDRARLEEHFLS